MNAQNWQTEARIIAPLRRLGVPAAALLDLDALWNPGSQWKAFYKALGLVETDPLSKTLDAHRVAAAVTPSERAAGKKAGLQVLPPNKRKAVRSAIDEFARYGIFFSPAGELESWLQSVGVTATGKGAWIVEMFRKLGSDPRKSSYLAPAKGDVWAFLDAVEAWIADPGRLGMP